MRVDDATRHQVYTAFQQLLGPERAAAVMTMLPDVDWDQLVTKEHLDLRLAAIEERLVSLEHRMGERIERTVRGQTKWIVGVVGTLILAMIGSTAAMVQAILSRVPVLD